MRVLFFGTRAFALPCLYGLLDRHVIVAVVTDVDRVAGEGQHRVPSPVKELAIARRLPVLQPANLQEPAWADTLHDFDADVVVTVAFGSILPRAVLEVPRHRSIGVHASLLPRYRGAAPVAWAIIRGEEQTGITTFRMDEGVDTGPILLQRPVAIRPGETAGELARRLATHGAETLLETLDRLGTLQSVPQDARAATRAPRLWEADGVLDWRWPARDLAARVRGVNPWPAASCQSPTGGLLIWRARAVPGFGNPGVLRRAGAVLAIGTGDGLLEPIEVQPQDRRVMAWDTFVCGARLAPGAIFSSAASPAA